MFFFFRLALKKCCQESGSPNPELSSFLENIRGAPLPMGWGDRRETGSSRLSMCLKTPGDPSLTCLSEWVTVCIISANTTHLFLMQNVFGAPQNFCITCLCWQKLRFKEKLGSQPIYCTYSGQAREKSGEYTIISLTITMRPTDSAFWYFLSSTPSRLKALLLSLI